MKLPDSIKRAVDEFSELPSIGPRQAIRLAFHLISQGKEHIRTLANAIDGLAQIKICDRCFFIHQNSGTRCEICENANRAQNIIMILEKETDLLTIENTGKFTGRYLVLGAIAKSGILEDWQKLRIQNLKNAITKELVGQAEEIIIAFNPTSAGDFNASLLTKDLAPFAKKISRLGRGLPTGGEVEFADDETLGSAIERRS
jgi:recombination protein RecR